MTKCSQKKLKFKTEFNPHSTSEVKVDLANFDVKFQQNSDILDFYN
jgi:hypothetical protein